MTHRRLRRHRLTSGAFYIVENIVCLGATRHWTMAAVVPAGRAAKLDVL